jgi:two-component system LytT family sensor kinase
MQLQLKTQCVKCGTPVRADGLAYICSYECTFCETCFSEATGSCPNCGGELVRRPRRAVAVPPVVETVSHGSSRLQPGLIWAVSLGVWTGVTLAAIASVYGLWRGRGLPMTFASVVGLETFQILTYVPLTPLVFALALRFPLRRGHWMSRLLLHLLFAVAFSIAHTTLRFVSPFAAWDPKLYGFISGIWNSQAHVFAIRWDVFRNLFLTNLVDDTTGAYVPIVVVAHALSYYWKMRDRELHSAKLQMQLAKSRLQTLKSHLQPHFLFNTMHSISALMLTDVRAADRMMARLSDLLRMSLENTEAQTTRLSRELEFVAGYLEIEKIRFEERLNIVLDIAPETLDALVPSLLLQPLVENAVRHGIARLSAGGTLWITAIREGNNLCVRIRDNGPGLAVPSGTSGTGLGIRTTRERLQTLYGDDQSFEIGPAPSGGVKVCIRLPFEVEAPALGLDEEAVFDRTTAPGTLHTQ